MEASGGQTPKRRRKTNYYDPGSPEPKPIYPTNRERIERITSSPDTNDYLVDEGYADPPRPKSSTVRLGSSLTGSMPQPTQTPPTTSIPRRQQAVPHQYPPRTTRKIAQPPEKKPPRSLLDRLKGLHWLALIGLGMMSALVLWLVGSSVLAWGTQRYYDVHYGNPRTFQTDMAVGHGGDSPAHPSHFVAINLNGQAIVIELKAGDPQKVATYKVPITVADGGQSPVTVSFKDVTGDHKLDMIVDIHLPGQDQLSYFINDGDSFRPENNTDVIQP